MDFSLAGLALGAGLACKLNLAALAIVIVLAAAIHLYRLQRDGTDLLRAVEHVAVRLVVAGGLALLAFRILQPIAFTGPSFFNFTLNPQWLANMQEIGTALRGDSDSPPGHQWTARAPLWFPWQNMVLWGMGLPLGLAAWGGFLLGAWQLLRKRQAAHLLPVAYVGLVFLYQGMQWVTTMRYFLPLYPILILLAAYLLVAAWDWAVRRGPRWPALLLIGAVVGGTILYALAFSAIYRQPHTRVQASNWIYANIPAGTTLAVEHWDDGLPLNFEGLANSQYKSVSLTNYDEDTPEKLDQLVADLDQAEYIILSSNRLYGSIPRLPLRYPVMVRYYDALLGEKLGFTKVAEFTSYPQLFGLALPDQAAEEAFTVYDHPKVTILRKTADFDAAQVRELLGSGIDWNAIIKTMPKAATKAPTGLMFSPADWQIYTESGTWTALFDPSGWTNRLPVLAWVLALLVLGLGAWPLTFVVLGGLLDRGYAVARTLGLLSVGWCAWLLASSRVLPFQFAAVAAGVVLVLGGSAAAAILCRRELGAFVRTHWRLLLVEEALWWGLFLLMLWVRWLNPDLWHPDRGGEKPMDFAFLNAVVRSTYFPPYDPWLAGGFINYYYWGFVLVGALVKLTGIMPAVAYNLAVPTFYAMTAVGGFSAALSLAGPARRARRKLLPGLLAVVFIAVLGNLGQIQVLWEDLQSRSAVQFETRVPGLVGAAKLLDGLSDAAAQGLVTANHPEKWYWNATRLIPHPPTEPGPINEFPLFTFLFADLHAHLMALPFTLLVLAFAVSIVRAGFLRMAPAPFARPSSALRSGPAARLRALPWREAVFLCALSLALGALWVLNTWDWPAYTAVAGLALACREYPRRSEDGKQRGLDWGLGLIGAVAWRWALIAALGYVFFLPFHRHYAGSYGGFTWWQGSRTPLGAYLTMHGFFLFLIGTYLVLELARGYGHNALVRRLRMDLRTIFRPHDFSRRRHLNTLLVRPTPGYVVALRSSALAPVVAILLFFGAGVVAALVFLLLALAVLLALSPRPAPKRQFTLGIMALGLALTLVPETIVLAGDVGRMNTVFKFYLQVWVLWSVAAAAVFPWLAAALSRMRRLRWAWWPAFALLLAGCLLYPLLAVPTRTTDRFAGSTAHTLDGTAYMQTAVYHDRDQDIPLDSDRQAMAWLQEHVRGTPVIVEANTPLYHWGGRVANNTGLPSVVGWDWHERQQRAVLPPEVVDSRLPRRADHLQ